MTKGKKLETPATLFAAIEAEQHEALRRIAFQERRSIADIVRQAIDEFVETHAKPSKGTKPERIKVTSVRV
jgi:hypothetical protein